MIDYIDLLSVFKKKLLITLLKKVDLLKDKKILQVEISLY